MVGRQLDLDAACLESGVQVLKLLQPPVDLDRRVRQTGTSNRLLVRDLDHGQVVVVFSKRARPPRVEGACVYCVSLSASWSRFEVMSSRAEWMLSFV